MQNKAKKALSRTWQLVIYSAVIIATVWLLSAGWGGHFDPRRWVVPAIIAITYPLALLTSLVVAAVCLIVKHWKCAVALLVVMLATWPALHVNAPLNFLNPS